MIGERIRTARTGQGLTQSALARKAELTPAAIWQMESGQREPSAGSLRKLAEALEVSADYLLGLNEAPVSDELAQTRLRLQYRAEENCRLRAEVVGLRAALRVMAREGGEG